ncbi:MAG: hypothetical protein AB7I19_17360 [Planctomycetota bacterium]
MTDIPHDTCWTVLRAASSGDADARSTFARRYEPTIHFFLAARWRGRALAGDIPDATQEVFVECVKPGGVLERAAAYGPTTARGCSTSPTTSPARPRCSTAAGPAH